MAGNLNSFQVFNDFLYKAVMAETEAQTNLFNEASNGALTLQGAANVGDFANVVKYALAGTVRRRNPYGEGDVASKQLGQLAETSVKVASGSHPINFEPQAFRHIQENPEEAAVMVAEQIAKDMVADRVNTAILVAKSALAKETDSLFTVDAKGPLSLGALTFGRALMGDAANQLACTIVHSKPMADLHNIALANSNNLFTYGNVNIVADPFGKRFVVVDADALVEADKPAAGDTRYSTLLLVPQAVVVEDNGDFASYTDEVLGGENVQRIMQSEWTQNYRVKGFSYAGPKAPTDAQLAAKSSWTRTAGVKGGPGVLIQSQ